ncbi:MAG: hypothetical protein J6S63_02950 [Atopobiaceae bacterium]|nr:hypothetical protein [Atopobiaceae bacterium]
MSHGHLTVGELRSTLAALPGDVALVVIIRDEDGQEMWADRISLGVMGDARWRSTYAYVDAFVNARVDWEWPPGGLAGGDRPPGDEDDWEIPF